MQPIELRLAQPGDIPLLRQIAIAAKSYWGYPASLIAQWAATPIITPAALARDRVCLAASAGTPIGWYRLALDRSPAWLDDLWVIPEWIGRGVGRLLLSDAIAACRARGIAQMELEADPNALGFYLRMGGVVIGERISEWNRPVPLVRLDLPSDTLS